MIQAALKQLKKDYGTEIILKDISFELNDNERVALIGKNGSGKTTILKIMTGEEKADQGDVMIRKGAEIGYLKQIPDDKGRAAVKEVIWSAFEDLQRISDQLRELESGLSAEKGGVSEKTDIMLKRYDSLRISFESKGGYEMEEQMARVCTGLKLTDEFLNREFEHLSGGEKTLVCLARILLQRPDILILDEPTNHLDMAMMEWLENYLKAYKGTVLLVSHDRYFLEHAVERILEVEDGRIEEYPGNYSYYITEKKRRREAQTAEYKEQQKKIKDMETAIKRMRIWAAQADNEAMFKRARAMQGRLDKMDRVEKVKTEKSFYIGFDDSGRSGKDVICVEGIEKSYSGNRLLKGFEMTVFFQEHVALLGRNGCGKTTLLKMILGEEEADSGSIVVGANVNIGYLPQNVSFPNESLTILETFREGMVITEGKAREALSKYLFYGEEVYKKVKNLSGGEKSRLFLAKLIQNNVNLLILDEPTNHLDIMSREKLEEALLSFQGTILVISHDRYFINRVATRIVEIEDGAAENYPGDYEYYKEEKMKRSLRKEESKKSSEQSGRMKAKSDGRNRESRSSDVQRRSKNTYKRDMLEEQIDELNLKIREIEIDMAGKASEYGELLKLEKLKRKTEAELEEKMEEWLAL